MYDTVIIGGGPAGVGAGVYTARKKMKTLVLAESFGGQSIVSDEIENWIGDKKISGIELARKLEDHLRAQEEVEVKIERVEKVKKANEAKRGFIVGTDQGEYQTKTVIIASGARHRQLGVAGEKEFNGKGVVYCSTCDAPMFRDKTVAVVGGGNAGLEAVEDLIPYAKEIYLLTHGDKLRGDQVTIDDIKKSDKFRGIIFNAEIKEIIGEQMVTGLKYKDKVLGEDELLEVQGLFVEIGAIPNSELVGDLVDKNEQGEIMVDHKTAATSCLGMFAAGDVTDAAYKQNNISVGDGVKAALSAYQYLKSY